MLPAAYPRGAIAPHVQLPLNYWYNIPIKSVYNDESI